MLLTNMGDLLSCPGREWQPGKGCLPQLKGRSLSLTKEDMYP